MYSKGFTFIELLLVLAIMAAIAIMSFRGYIEYQRQTQINAVKSDVNILMQAIHRYYRICGCDQHGNLNANCHLSPDIINDLNLPLNYESRLPIVDHYAVAIVDTGSRTKENKPVYTLRVFADLNSNYSKSLIDWYRLRLGASTKGATNSNEITWTTLADIRINQLDDPLWVMEKSLSDFRRDEMIKTRFSDSYCAW